MKTNLNKIVLIFLFINNLFAIDNTSTLSSLPLFSIIPFIGILLSIAIFPLVNFHFWEENFGKISAFWSLLFFVPFWYIFKSQIAFYELFHVLLLEYIPFIILLLALYTISGGIRLKGNLIGTPILNTGILLFGTSIASFMGTTGAAMLLIRPLIRANSWRKKTTHIFVFLFF